MLLATSPIELHFLKVILNKTLYRYPNFHLSCLFTEISYKIISLVFFNQCDYENRNIQLNEVESEGYHFPS